MIYLAKLNIYTTITCLKLKVNVKEQMSLDYISLLK